MAPRIVTRDDLAGAARAAFGGGRRLAAVERLAGDFPRREFMRGVAEHNLKEALALAKHADATGAPSAPPAIH
jgi:hypothetical protein